jgi:hypothetical protein
MNLNVLRMADLRLYVFILETSLQVFVPPVSRNVKWFHLYHVLILNSQHKQAEKLQWPARENAHPGDRASKWVKPVSVKFADKRS